MPRLIELKEEEVVKPKKSKKADGEHTPEKLTHLQNAAWKLKISGRRDREIAEKLGAPVELIRKLIRDVQEELKEENRRLPEEIVNYLWSIYREYNDAWAEMKSAGELKPEAIVCLEGARKVLADIRAVMGIDAPKKKEISSAEGKEPYKLIMHLDGITR